MKRYLDDGTIEVAPLAYMRGRTLNDAFVILDEAQNTTSQQMKMFLTRLGFNTKMVITGDITQVDLDVPRSGLASIESILGGIDDIAFVHLGLRMWCVMRWWAGLWPHTSRMMTRHGGVGAARM